MKNLSFLSMNRRAFVEGMLSCGALASFGGFKAFGASAETGALLTLGVMSDVHIKDEAQLPALTAALEYFRDNGAEAVLVAGDIADTGRISELELFAKKWFEIFPNDQAPDGRKVERLFVYGNHCIEAWRWDDNPKNRPGVNEAIGRKDNRAKVWERIFHEEYQPIWMKVVKGVPVIGAHWIEAKPGIQIVKFLDEHAKEIDPKIPFIYTQHAHPKNTCIGDWAWGHDDGRSTWALMAFPNAIAFSGHSHYTLTDERSVWQGAFTSINTSSLRYSSGDYSLRENMSDNGDGFWHEGREHRMPNLSMNDGKQGMLVKVFADHLVITRREFNYGGQSLGEDWVVPLPAGSKPFSYASRAKSRVAPEFAAGAKVEVRAIAPKNEKDFTHITLTFPAAETRQKCRVFEYEVTAILCEDDVELVQAQRRIFADDFYLPATMLNKTQSFVFAAEDLHAKGRYRFEVRPIECMGKKGAAISSDIFKVQNLKFEKKEA